MDIDGKYTEVLIRWMERLDAGQPGLVALFPLDPVQHFAGERHRLRAERTAGLVGVHGRAVRHLAAQHAGVRLRAPGHRRQRGEQDGGDECGSRHGAHGDGMHGMPDWHAGSFASAPSMSCRKTPNHA